MKILPGIIETLTANQRRSFKDVATSAGITERTLKAAEVGADLCEAYTDADEVLGVLQNDVYRNADRPHDSIGRPINWIGSKAIPRECWGIVEWVQGIIDNPVYRGCTSRRENGTLNIMEFKK